MISNRWVQVICITTYLKNGYEDAHSHSNAQTLSEIFGSLYLLVCDDIRHSYGQGVVEHVKQDFRLFVVFALRDVTFYSIRKDACFLAPRIVLVKSAGYLRIPNGDLPHFDCVDLCNVKGVAYLQHGHVVWPRCGSDEA